MTSKPKTRTYVVTVEKKVYAEVAVELPEAGFDAEFAIATAMNDIAGMSAEEAMQEGAVFYESDWQFNAVGLAEHKADPDAPLAHLVVA